MPPLRPGRGVDSPEFSNALFVLRYAANTMEMRPRYGSDRYSRSTCVVVRTHVWLARVLPKDHLTNKTHTCARTPETPFP